MKILMVGNKESGKTTYMASAFGLLTKGISGYYIRTDNSTEEWFHRLYNQLKTNGIYPDATDKRGSYNFDLYYNQRKVLDFEWIDYNGGIITDTSIENLTDDINSSDGMMIFLDSVALLQNRVSAHRFRRIIALISQKLEENEGPFFSVIIVLTKYDKLPKDVSISDVTAPIQQFIDSADQNDHIYIRVIPVSCTCNGFFNADLPLLDILDSGLKISYLTAIEEAKYYAAKANEYQSKVGFFDWAFSRLNGVQTNGEIATEMATKARQRIELFESLELPTQNLSDYVKNYTVSYPNDRKEHSKICSSLDAAGYIDL